MKYFFIGFNKCATGTIEKIFELNSIKFKHRLIWEIEKYDGFSDTGVLPFNNIKFEKELLVSHVSDDCYKYIEYDHNNYINFKQLYELYPTAFFVLNTRPLRDWIYSRLKHGYIHKKQWAFPPTKQLINTWIKNRDLYYMDILSHFRYNMERFFIVDISSKHWQKKMCDVLGLKYFNDQFKNVSATELEMITKIDSVFSDLMLSEYTLNTILVTDEKKSEFYINHYKSKLIS